MNIKIILYIDQLVKSQSTGSPAMLAEKLGLTERSVFYYLKFMKEELKAPIVYSKSMGSYKYDDEGRFCFEWVEG